MFSTLGKINCRARYKLTPTDRDSGKGKEHDLFNQRMERFEPFYNFY